MPPSHLIRIRGSLRFRSIDSMDNSPFVIPPTHPESGSPEHHGRLQTEQSAMSRSVAPGALPDRAKQLPYNGLPHGHDAQG